MAETPYVETEVLLAVLNGERDRADAMLREMSVNERQEFALKVRELRTLIARVKKFLPQEEPPVDALVRWLNAENDRPRYAVRYDNAADGWKVTGLSSRITWRGIQSMAGRSLEVLKDGTWVPLES